jgi:magnesium chelatase family protein
MHLEVPAVAREVLMAASAPGERSATVRARVERAHQLALTRAGCTNARLGNLDIERVCVLGDAERRWLESVLTRLDISARAFHRILKVARTIADLAGETNLSQVHLAEAVQYRLLDRRAA